MTLRPSPVELEARLDALGRAMATHAESAVPAAFVALVGRRRRAIAVRKAGVGGGAVGALMVLVILAQHRATPPQRPEVREPTFASLRTIEDVDAAPRATSPLTPAPPIPRAGERPDGEVARKLVDFK